MKGLSRGLKVHNIPEDVEDIFIEINLITNKLHFCKCQPNQSLFRSSHPEVVCKEGVLKNMARFTGKHPEFLFDKVAASGL